MKYWKMMKKKCLKLKSKLASKKPEKNPLLSTNAAVDIFKEFSSSE